MKGGTEAHEINGQEVLSASYCLHARCTLVKRNFEVDLKTLEISQHGMV